ncbi:MAG: hypothetical protein JNK05_18160 [Myxococcales bacterium]|nr:hypothetical protein [Myxococcales bacterium]
MRFAIASRRVACARCNGAIEPGDLVIDASDIPQKDPRWRQSTHPMCLAELDPGGVQSLLTDVAFGDYDASNVRPLLSESVSSALDARILELRRQRIPGCPPERDRCGRPCVTILVTGSGTELFSDWRGPLRYRCFASAHREYYFESESSGAPKLPTWRPLIGSVFAIQGNQPPARTILRRLAAWKLRSFATPAIALIGDQRASGAIEERARALLTEAGFVGDGAVCVHGEAFDEAFVAQLGVALDEAIEHAPVSFDPASAPRPRQWIDRLRSLLDEAREEQLASILERINERYASLSRAEREEAATLAARCVRFDAARVIALTFVRRFDGDRERCSAIGDALREQLANQPRVARVEPLLALLRQWHSSEGHEALAEALRTISNDSALGAAIVDHLSRLRDEGAGRAIAVLAERSSGEHRATLDDIARTIAKRAAKTRSKRSREA